jgi:putative DNA-invertase from lambdoid prophage Rac
MKKEHIPRVIAYLRISSSKQDLASQRHEIEEYTKAKGLPIDQTFEVEMSARSNGMGRRRIDELLQTLGKGDILITSELSRLGRSVKDVSFIASELFRKGVAVHVIKQGMVLSKAEMNSKIIVWVFGILAELESDLISARTKAGLAAARERGSVLGNPHLKSYNKNQGKGADEYARSLEKTIRGYLAQGFTERKIRDALNEAGFKTRRKGTWHLPTVQALLKRLDLSTKMRGSK